MKRRVRARIRDDFVRWALLARCVFVTSVTTAEERTQHLQLTDTAGLRAAKQAAQQATVIANRIQHACAVYGSSFYGGELVNI